MVWKLRLAQISLVAASAVLGTVVGSASAQEVKVGAMAPTFTATDSNGKTDSLDQFRGKYVVLEWTNRDCPFTKKHYTSGNMQSLQKEWTAKGIVWLSVLSSAPGQEGYVTASQENAYLKKMNAVPTSVLMDPDGKLGRMYSAKTTPQMVIIDPKGKVVYDGAIDDKATADIEDIKVAKNYVNEALQASLSGKPVPNPYTQPYGCSVKYGN